METAALETAMAHHRQGRVADALALYRRILAQGPGDPRVLNLAGIAYAQQGDVDQAIEHLRRAVDGAPDFADAQRNLGIALRDAGRRDEAVAAHQRLVELAPESAQAHLDLGITLRRAGRLSRSADSYRRALELEPESAEAMVNLANVLQDQDRAEEACSFYRRAVDLNPGLAAAHRSLGNALQRLGRLDQAIDSYRRAVTADDRYAAAYSELGGALVESGELAEGIRCLRRGLDLDPGAAGIHSNLGMALHHTNDLDGALAAYEESLKLEPGNSHALAHKSITLLELGRMDALRRLVDHDTLIHSGMVDAPEGYSSVAKFNRALCQFASNHPTLMGKDDRRPGITGELLSEPEGPMPALEQAIRAQVARYLDSLPEGLEHPFVKRRRKNLRMIGWANVLDGGADTHIHPHAWISGVYYARALSPDQAGGGDQAGWLEFGSPDPAFELTREPEVRAVRPRDGLMLLFPSFFWHRILPFESAEKRISYAFDIFPLA